MSIRNSAALVIASMALGLSLGTTISISALRGQPGPAIAVVPSPIVLTHQGQAPSNTLPNTTIVTPPIQYSYLQQLIPARAGQPVTTGSSVLARWYDGTWWEAQITARGQNTVTAAWADGSPATELPASGVAPLPQKPDQLEVGEYALCSWQSSTRWWGALISSRDGVPTIEYVDGDSAPLSTERCVRALVAAD